MSARVKGRRIAIAFGLQRTVLRIGHAFSALDARDWHFYGGLAIAAAGGVRLSPPLTLVAIGAVLALVGLRRSR